MNFLQKMSWLSIAIHIYQARESNVESMTNFNRGTLVGLWCPGSPSSRVILSLLVSSLPLETVQSIQIPPMEVVV